VVCVIPVYENGKIIPDYQLARFVNREELKRPAIQVCFLPVIEWKESPDIKCTYDIVPKVASTDWSVAGIMREKRWIDAAYFRSDTTVLRSTRGQMAREMFDLWDSGLIGGGSRSSTRLGVFGNPGRLPNNQVFGNGLETTFWINFRKYGAGVADAEPSTEEFAALFDKVKSFDVYMVFLDRKVQHLPSLTEQITEVELNLPVNGSPAALGRQQTSDDSDPGFDALWNQNSSDNDIPGGIDRLITRSRSFVPMPKGEIVDEAVGKIFSSQVEGQTSGYRAPSLQPALQIVRAIWSLLLNVHTEEYSSPLNSVVAAIQEDEAALRRIGAVNNALAIFNSRRENVTNRLAEMEKVRDFLNDVSVSDEETEELNRLLAESIGILREAERHEVLKILCKGEVRPLAERAIISFVILEIIKRADQESGKHQ
jgi:hypothetical protein